MELQAQTSTQTQVDFKDMFNIYIMEEGFFFKKKFNGGRKKPEAQAHSFVVQDRVVHGQQQLPKADQITHLW